MGEGPGAIVIAPAQRTALDVRELSGVVPMSPERVVTVTNVASFRRWTGLKEDVQVASLLLDPKNPRLPEELQGGEQPAILAYLFQHDVLTELADSYIANGFFPERTDRCASSQRRRKANRGRGQPTLGRPEVPLARRDRTDSGTPGTHHRPAGNQRGPRLACRCASRRGGRS